MINLIYIVSYIFFIDYIGIYISKKFNQIIDYNTRWFFIHFITNIIVCYYSFFDLVTCLSNNNNCYELSWNDNSYNTFNLAMGIHFYHLIFMSLNYNDVFHHIIMCFIAGSFCYYQNSILTSSSLFFLNGLPGAIDYFLLWLTKLNIINKLFEKKAYIYISVWLRSPGSLIITYLGYIGLYNYYINKNYFDLIILFIPINLLFWNGQYYMMITCRDNYIKLLS